MSSDILSSSVRDLWETTKQELGSRIEDYSDDNWCEEYPADEYFAFILSWGPLREPARKAVWTRIESILKGKRLTDLLEGELRYPLPWQNRFFSRLVSYLKNNQTSAEEFVRLLHDMGYRNAKATLMQIVQSDSQKIVDCWLRDLVKLDAFPIDSNVKRVLKRFRIPADSDFIVQAAQSLNIPVRQFARAVYDEADSILLHAEKEED